MRTATAVKAELKELRTKYEEVIAKNDPSHEAELREMDGKIETLLAEYSSRAQDEAKAESNRQAMAQIFAPDSKAAKPTSDGDKSSHNEKVDLFTKSIGELFTQNRHFKAWYDEMTSGGTQAMPSNMSVKSPVVELGESLLERKAVITGLSSTSGGALVVNDRTNILVPAVRDEMRVVDLMRRMTTNSDTVEYVQVTTETNAAAGVLEATAVNDGAKPESSVAMAVVSEIVETIAHYINITRRAAADAGQLRAYVDDFLMWGLMDTLNDQVINGTGTTPQLQGLDDLSGTQAQAWDTDILTTTRKARTLVRTVGGATPTAYVLNPADWQTIDLTQDNEARYYFGGPARVGTPMLWGLPVVEDEAVTAGLGFVGDWRMGIIWDREQARIYMTDSHSDYFIRNILTLLAEMRVAIGWLRPAAFVEIDLTA